MKKRQRKKNKLKRRKGIIIPRDPSVADGSLFNTKSGLLDRDKKRYRSKKRRREDNGVIKDERDF